MKVTLLPGVGLAVAAAVIALLREYASRVRDERLRAILTALVEAAEQIYGPGNGDAKRRYVRERMKQKGLTELGREDLEAAVYGLQAKPEGEGETAATEP